MVRLPRFVIPGQPQHVIIRGNNREPIFHTSDDYRFYIDKLKKASEKHNCDIHSYVMMTNHVHLLTTPYIDRGIGNMVQMLGRYYVQYFNYSYKRSGTLWEGRYKATLVDSVNYLLTCYRYIELNPVRARGMVNHPGDYPWSSYRYNALGEDDPIVVPHEEYLRLGKTPAERQAAYKALFNIRIGGEKLEEIRQATNKGWVLGGSDFKERIERQINRQVSPKARGGDRRSNVYRNIDRV